jgi:DNA-binding beta-propeller fold protein YncE
VVLPVGSSRRSIVGFVVTLLTIWVTLFAPPEAHAAARRRAWLPSGTGIQQWRLGVALPNVACSAGRGPIGLTFSPDGRWLYGVRPDTGELQVCNLVSPGAAALFPFGLNDATGIVVAPQGDGLKAYVSMATGALVVIDISSPTPSVLDTTVTAPLVAIDIAPDGAWVYITTTTGDLLRVDPDTHQVVQSLPLGLTPGVGLDVSDDGTRAVVTGMSSGNGRVQRVDLTNWTLDGGDIAVGGDPRNVVITPDGATALVADHGGRILFIDMATGSVSQTVTDLSALTGLNTIDVEPNGLTAWFTDRTTGMVWELDLATRIATDSAIIPTIEFNGKFLSKPIFLDTAVDDIVNADAELTTLGFGREVIILGPVTLTDGFTSDRTFRFVETPQLDVTGAVTLTGILQGSGFVLAGSGHLHTTGIYTLDGTTTVNAAIYEVDGVHDGAIALASGATLAGTGTVGDVTAGTGAIVRPGAIMTGRGILTAGNAVFETGSTLAIDIAGTTAGLSYDQLNTTGATFQTGVALQPNVVYASAPGDAFTILTNHNGASNPFQGTTEGSTIVLAGVPAIVRYTGGDGNEVTLQIHTPPTAAPIGDSTIDEDTIYNGSVTIGDDVTPVDNLNLLVTSSNQTLVPAANILWGTNGSVRSLQIAPVADLTGSTTITVRVSDPHWFFERTFVLAVGAVNDTPTASPIGPHSTAEDTTTTPIAFTVGDIDSPVNDLIVTATSSDQAIVPNANIVGGGSGANRTLTITPAANAHGDVIITVRTSDGAAHIDTTFQLTINPVNDSPSISSIGNRTIEQDSSTGLIPFTITDDDGFDGHSVTASSSNPTLVPNTNTNLAIGGAAGSWTLAVTPAAGQHGTATITVTVDDGETEDSTTFQLTVNAAPDPPEPTPITYYLAEGATGPFFDTDLLLANPNALAAPITLTWLLEGGGTITESRTLAPMSRTTIRVDEIDGLEAAAFTTMVTSTAGHAIAVERTMRWGDGGYGAHTEKATDPGGTTWYFAEGAAGFFSTYLLLGNPQAAANTAHVTWLREGETPLARDYPLPPNSRFTVDTRADAELIDRSFGAHVVFDLPGVAERAMYFGADLLWSGGHDAAGAASLARRWDFAEGATGSYFTTFLLLANPGATQANVTLTFFPEGGTPVTRAYTLAAGQRLTRNIAFEHPSLASAAVAMRVDSTEPIVSERAQYWGAPTWIESHSSFGVTTPGRRWALAEGRVGGADGAQTYILLFNPGASAATATLTFLRTNGTTVVKTVDVPAASRVTVGVIGEDSAVVPELVNESFGTLIESTQPIVVERSLYSNVNGVIWAAGTNATAAALPEP